jgi:hypothetical protein
MGGGRRAAELAVSVAERHRVTLAMRSRGARRVVDDATRTLIMSVLGAKGTDAVRRLVRRPALGGVGSPIGVRIVSEPSDAADDGITPLLFTESVRIEDTAAATPIEHLIEGSSAEYRRRRRAIIERNYRVRDD